MVVLYQGVHRSQYDGTRYARENCTPDSGANGARASTGGGVDVSGGYIRSQVTPAQETSPSTPGWSIPDLDLAMSRMGVPFARGEGGWPGVMRARASRLFVVLQGVSDQFPNGTCSGVFDGAHAVGLHPDPGPLILLADPICKARRWESESVLRRYASAFRESIAFGVFTHPVPELKVPPVVAATGWVHVIGRFWQYKVAGNVANGYEVSRAAKTTKGFSANVDTQVELYWGARDRVFARIMAPSAYAGTWVDLLDEPNVRYIKGG